jgi:VanZ family protein
MPTRFASNVPLAWALVAAWGAIIWSLGSTPFSADETSRFLGPLLRWLLPSLTPEEHARALFQIRKLAHLAEYGLFALLSFRALLMSLRRPRVWALAICLGMSGILASADELHQSSTDARTGTVGDVLLDLVGASVALVGLILLEQWRGAPLTGRPLPAKRRPPTSGTKLR